MVAVLIIAILPLSFLGLKLASHHPAVKRALFSRIAPEVEGQLSVGELEIGLASLSLGDVSIDMGDRGSIHVPAATVSLRYPRLVARGLEARRALGTVIVSRPTIVVRRGLADTIYTDAGDQLSLASLGQYLPDYLGVSDATVVVEDAASGSSVEVTSLDLFIEKRGGALATGDAVGDALGGTDNLTASLRWDVETNALDVDAELIDADLSVGSVLPARLPLHPVSGSASVVASGAIGRVEGGAGIEVAFELTRAELSLPGDAPPLRDVFASGDYDGASLTFSVREARWGGADLSAGGGFELSSLSFDPLDVRLEGAPAALVERFAGRPVPDLSGEFDLQAHAEGTWAAPTVDVQLRADSLSVGGVVMSGLEVRGALRDTLLTLEGLEAACMGGDVVASGAMNRAPGDTVWNLTLEADVGGLSASELAAAAGDSGWAGEVSLTGFRARRSGGTWDVESLVAWTDLRAGAVSLSSGAGGLLLRDGSLAATFSSREEGFSLSGEVEDVFDRPVVDAELSLSELTIGLLSGRGTGQVPDVSLSGAVTVAGPVDSLKLAGLVVAAGEDASGSLTMDGSLRSTEAGREANVDLDIPDAIIRGVAVPISASVAIDGEGLTVSAIKALGMAEAAAEIAFGEPGSLSGSVVASEASLRDVFSILSGERLPESVDGLVFASVSLGGTLESPKAEGQIQIGNGRAFGVDGLDAAVSATLDGGAVSVREAMLRERGTEVLTLSGSAELGGELALSVRGRGIPGPLLGGDADTRFELSLGVGGTTESPALDGRVEAERGEFLGVAFDDFLARVTGAGRTVRIDPLRLEKRGSYTVSANAALPFEALGERGGEREGTLSIEVDGDPMSFLAEIAPFASRTSGSGRMRANLVGHRGAITVASAQLSAEAASIHPTTLFERVDDLRVDVSIVDGRVERGRIEGRVDGSPIAVESVRGAEADGHPLAPLVLGGVDAGVLAVSTERDGVRSAVPGLMLPGDAGRVGIRGKGDSGAFLVGGPTERPFLWGELEFSDVSFTYPLLESDGGLAGGLFPRAEWSMRMTAGRNLWYERADANLQLVRGGSLDFVGIPDEGTLCVSGRIESKRGHVTYANTDFDVREVIVDFPLFCEPPRFFVEAETRVEDGTTISLVMESFEGAFASSGQGATLDESALRLTSDSPDDNTQEEILAKLQYGVSYELLEAEEQAALDRRRAVEVIGSQLSGRIVRPLLSPVEGRIKRSLRLDLVRFDIDFVEHFLGQLDLWQAQEASAEYQPFLADSRITLGKYFSRDWLLSYVGFAEAYEEDLGDRRLGLRHEFGVEYEVSRNTSISMRVVYDPLLAGWDRRISVENRYDF